MATGTTAASSARTGVTSSMMPRASLATGRFSNSERWSFFQIAVSGSGTSFARAPAARINARPASAARSRKRLGLYNGNLQESWPKVRATLLFPFEFGKGRGDVASVEGVEQQ